MIIINYWKKTISHNSVKFHFVAYLPTIIIAVSRYKLEIFNYLYFTLIAECRELNASICLNANGGMVLNKI